jgi:eukaryotic-like serine/threonine-protein kinase
MSTTPTVVAGRYRLLRQLGAGGMGQVWLAHDDMLDRHVAIKQVVLPPGLSADETIEARERTMREARTAAQLNHPSVVKIYDVVETDEQPWIVMEYIPARSLHEIVNEDGPLEPVQVARIGLAVLDALEAAHQAGVLHRDVKPGNVLLTSDDRVVLTDFGLATFDTGESALTQPGLVFGSVRFVAPERARDGTSSPEADLWALGATLYAAVEGQSPYARQTAMETLTALATSLPDPPRRAGPLKPVLRGLLRRDPRYRLTVPEARRLLQRAAGEDVPRTRRRLLPRQHRPTPAVPAVAPIVTGAPAKAPTVVLTGHGTSSPSGNGAAPARPGPSARRRPWLVWLAVAGAAVLVAAVSVVVATTARGTKVQTLHPSRAPTAAARSAVTVADPFLGGSVCPTANHVPLHPTSRKPGWDALIPGWVWYQDPSGFRIAVPGDWQAYTGGTGICFRDDADIRWLGVTMWTPAGGPNGHLTQEQRELVGGNPAGYRLIGTTTVPYYRGGADWEFGFQNRSGVRMHGLVRDFTVSPGRGYTIAWCTTEFDWTTNLANWRLVVASFGLPA